MEKRKAQMMVEERDRRAEELKNQMMNVIPEVEEFKEDELPFEISGIDETPAEEVTEEAETVEEKKDKKKTDTQTTLFSF